MRERNEGEFISLQKLNFARSYFLRYLYILIFFCFISSAQGRLYSGAGTQQDPFIIDSAEKMNDIGLNQADWDKHFMLDADIDLSAYTGTQFNMIGYRVLGPQGSEVPFTGVFDGNGFEISNFTYSSTGIDRIGVFLVM